MKLKIKNNKVIIFLLVLVIFAISLFLRLYHLDQNIPSLYADEVSGNYLSLNFLSVPTNNPIDLINKVYLGITHFSWVFGLTPLGARLPSAIYGSLITIVIFYLSFFIAKQISPNKGYFIALLSGFLVSVLPWSFMISRIGHSSVPVMVIFVCLHLIMLIKAKKTSQYLISLIPLGISLFFYPSLIIIAPVATLLVYYLMSDGFTSFQRRLGKLALIITAIIIILIGITRYRIFEPDSRGFDLAIWRDVNVTADSNYYRGLSRESNPTIFSFGKDPEILGNKLVFNFPVSVINVFTKNYLSFFSPDFLFLKGDSILRHSTGMVGEFFPFLLPFMLYGAFVFFTKADKKLKTIFLVWIFISPVPAAITKDGATYLLRVITLMPFITYFCAQGIVSSFRLFKNNILKIAYGGFISIIGLFSIYYFLFGYFHIYPALSASHWEYGFKELSDFQVTHPGKLLTIWEDKYPVWYFCFWQKLPFDTCNPDSINMNELVNDNRIDLPVENLLFSLPKNESDLNSIIQKFKPMYIAIPNKYKDLFPNFENNEFLVQTINYPDQTTSISVYKVNF